VGEGRAFLKRLKRALLTTRQKKEDTFLEEVKMNKKKTLFVLFLFSFALFSFSFPNTDTNPLIVESSLPTAPPGYTIQQTFGSFFYLDEVQQSVVNINIQKAVTTAIAQRGKEIAAAIQKRGANAILNEKITVSFLVNPTLRGSDTSAFVLFTGEAVLLKEETPSKK
jgi:hypothetical protein